MRIHTEDIAARLALARRASPYLDTHQAAFYLGITKSWLEKMRAHEGSPKYRYHGRFVRYHVDDLDEWSRAHEKTSEHKSKKSVA